MIEEEIATSRFLKSVTHQEILRFEKFKPQNQEVVYLSKDSSEKKQCLLYNDAIILIDVSQSKIDETGGILYFCNDFRMTIVQLTQMENPESAENRNPKIIGIRLTQENYDDLEIFFNHPLSEASAFIKNISRKVFRTDFRERFQLVKKIGRGSFSSVYSVRRKADSKLFAVKGFSKTALSQNREKQKCFFQEIETLRVLDHKSIMKFYGACDSGRSFYVIFELIKGCSLQAILKQAAHLLNDESIPHMLFTLLEGLKYMSKKRVMHRDIKPENIMVRGIKKGETSADLALIDFDFAEFCDKPEYLLNKCGSPGFLAPEIINMKEKTHIEPICDIFSAGSTFYTMLTKKLLFNGSTVPQVFQKNKSMAIEIDKEEICKASKSQAAYDLLHKMLQKDPKQRICAEEALKHPYFQEKLGVNYEAKLNSPIGTELP